MKHPILSISFFIGLLITQSAYSAQSNKENLNKQLFNAARNDHPEKIIQLIESGANPNFVDTQLNNNTPLMVAVNGGNINSAHALLVYGANPLIKNIKGRNAIWFANYNRNSAMLNLLNNFASNFQSNQKREEEEEEGSTRTTMPKKDQIKKEPIVMSNQDIALNLINKIIDQSDIMALPDTLKTAIAKEYYLLPHRSENDPVPEFLQPYFKGVSAGEEIKQASTGLINTASATKVVYQAGKGVTSLTGLAALINQVNKSIKNLSVELHNVPVVDAKTFEKFTTLNTLEVNWLNTREITIKNKAFYNLYKLTSMTLSGKETMKLVLENDAFSGLRSLERLNLNFSKVNIDDINFDALSKLPDQLELSLHIDARVNQTNEDIARKLNKALPRNINWQVIITSEHEFRSFSKSEID